MRYTMIPRQTPMVASIVILILLMLKPLGAFAQGSAALAWYHFDELSGSIVSDSSGNDNVGTAIGTDVVTGLLGNARNYNGSADYVRVARSTSLTFPSTSSFMIEAWVFPRNVSGTNGYGATGFNIIGTNWAAGVAIELRFLNDQLYFIAAASPGDGNFVVSNSRVVASRWYYVVATRDAATHKLRLYLDGRLDAESPTVSFSTLNPEVDWAVGAMMGADNQRALGFFDGIIDELKISSGTKTSNEILAAYNTVIRQTFHLQFPLKDASGKFGNPDKWPVTAIFDHSMPIAAFCSDTNTKKGLTRVVSFKGEIGSSEAGEGDEDPNEKPKKLRDANDGLCGKGPRLQGYPQAGGGPFFAGLDGTPGTSDDPLAYTGGGTGRNSLAYDGHPGYDYEANFMPVYAAAPGTVELADDCKIQIMHAGGYRTVYDHLSDWSFVSPGQVVAAGERIATSGDCRTKGAAHLHFGAKLPDSNGDLIEVDPYGWSPASAFADPYLDERLRPGIVNRRLWP